MTTVTEVSGAWRVGAGVRSEDSVRGCEEAGPGSEEGGWSKGRQGQAERCLSPFLSGEGVRETEEPVRRWN